MTAHLPVRVLVVDDSATVRAVLRRLFARSPDLEVAGEATNGADAVAAVLAIGPDVVLMDIDMPGMDGFAATERIMALRPTPIVILTSQTTSNGVATAFEAIRRGALEVLAKPTEPAGWDGVALTMPAILHAAAATRLVRPDGVVAVLPPGRAKARAVGAGARTGDGGPRPRTLRLVAIGASTGGPQAIHQLLANLPALLPVPILIVQHIAAGFEQGLSEWLAADLHRDVAVARDGEVPPAGSVRIAAPGAHLHLDPGFRIALDSATPPRGGHRPSVDELFASCARAHPRECAGVLLSGMGRDGAEGLLALHRAGGWTFAQDEATSVVFGMPKAAIELGGADLTMAPGDIAHALARCWAGPAA